MSALKQIASVTAMNIRAIPRRLGTSLVVVIGIAGVVAVMVSMLGMSTGMRKTMTGAGRPDRIVVMSKGAQTVTNSNLTRAQAASIMGLDGISKDADGKPMASAMVYVGVDVVTRTGIRTTTSMLGFDQQMFAIRPEVKLTSGRMFQPAVREMIAGKSALTQFKGFEIGKTVPFRNSDWTIVGTFEAGGDTIESYMLADPETLLSAFQRNTVQDVMAVVKDEQAFATFKAALAADPTLETEVWRENDLLNVYASQGLAQIMKFAAYVVGGIMAVGALFGALNTMYSAVSTRALEIATLRAIGFSATPVLISVVSEALLLALGGGIAGALIAWALFDGNSMSSTMGTGVQLESFLVIDAPLMIVGVVWSVVIGLIGGLFPAIRAARLPVATALQVR
jgi:putative ABC transport system permease protein